METAITFVREWISTVKSQRTNDDSANYGDIDKSFSEGILAILTDNDLSEDEAVEKLDTLFASLWEHRHPRYVDLFLDVRQMVQPEKAEMEKEGEEEWELIGTSP